MDKNTNKKSGFNRLRTLTTGTLTAAAIAMPAMSVRAGYSPSTGAFLPISNIEDLGAFSEVAWHVRAAGTCQLQIENASAKCSGGFEIARGRISGTYITTDTSSGVITTSYSTNTNRSIIDDAFNFEVGAPGMYTNRFTAPIANTDLSNNTVTSALDTDIIDGVDASVQFRFYEKRALARALYTLTNTTDNDIMANVYVSGSLASESSIELSTTSSGNNIIEDHDYWSITRDTSHLERRTAASTNPNPESTTPYTIITRYGEGAQVIPSSDDTLGGKGGNGGPGSESFEYIYAIIIPANSTVHLANFIEIHTDQATAYSSATDFSSAAALQSASLIDDAASLLKGPVLNYGINGDNAPSTPSSLDKVDAATNSTGAAGITLPGLGILAGLLMARRRRQKS